MEAVATLSYTEYLMAPAAPGKDMERAAKNGLLVASALTVCAQRFFFMRRSGFATENGQSITINPCFPTSFQPPDSPLL